MEPELCLSEKHGSLVSDGNRSFSEIRHTQYKHPEDLPKLSGLFWEYQKRVNHQDLDFVKVVEFDGRNVEIHGVELFVELQKRDGARFHIAWDGEEPIGLIISQPVVSMLWVRGFYIDKKYEGQKIAREFFKSNPDFRTKILYQTQHKYPPTRLMEHIGKQSFKIHDDGNLVSWLLDWKEN